jgi:hypothetical protein
LLPNAPPALLQLCLQQLPTSSGAEAGELLMVLVRVANDRQQQQALGDPALLSALEAAAAEVQANWSQLHTQQLVQLLQLMQSAQRYFRHQARQGWVTPFTHAWWRAVSLQVEDVAGWMSAKQLHYTAWSLARLGTASGPALSALAAQGLQLEEGISDCHLAKLLTAFALLKHQRPVTLALCRAAANRLAQYGPLPAGASTAAAPINTTVSSGSSSSSSSSSSAQSGSSAAVASTAEAGPAASVARVPSPSSRSSSPQEGDEDLTAMRGRVLWCCASLGYAGRPQLRGLLNGILSSSGRPAPHVVAWVAWSSARLQLGNPAVHKWCVGHMDWAAARPAVAADAVWGLWKMGE